MRLFFAIPATIDNLKSIRQDFDMIDARWVKQENLHLTLLFLGDTQPETIIKKLKNLNFTPEKIALHSLGTFGHPPRILYAKVKQSEQLLQLRKNLLETFAQDKRQESYIPHVTLARIKKISSISRMEEKIEHYEQKTLGYLSLTPLLIQSILTAQGPCYKVIKRV